MAGYYDYVLGMIPAVMLVPVLTAAILGFSVQLAVIAGGAIAVPFVGHALFVRAPVTDESAAEESPTVSETASVPAAD